MENENILDTNLTSGLLVDSTAKQALSETGSWGKFFAILMFIFSGIFTLVAIGMIFFMSSMATRIGVPGMGSGMLAGMGVMYLLFAAIYIMPALYLWRFSTKVKSSINTNDQAQFTEAIVNLKSCYKFFGIFTIVILAFYLIMLVFGLGAAVLGDLF